MALTLRIPTSFVVLSFYLLICFFCVCGWFSFSGYAQIDSTIHPNQKAELRASSFSSFTSATETVAGQSVRAKMETRVATANNKFGFDLFRRLQAKDTGANLFFSPISIAFALTMTYNGAAGETQQALSQVLGLDGMSLAEINQANAMLMKSPGSSDPRLELSLANSLWARQGITFKADFLARNRQFFGAAIASLNFSSPRAKATINNWVSGKTKGRIPVIIDQIDAQQVLFLVNAIYFKGQWQKRFDKALTRDEPFYLLSGAPQQVPMMSQSGGYQYFQGDKFQALCLPYGHGSTSLYLFLPEQNSSLSGFLSGLSYEAWEEWMTRFQEMPGEVKIPRFKLDYEVNLNETLKALGMEVAFTAGKADFSGMSSQRNLFISEVRHKAVIDLNEQGTTAAAATSVGIGVTSIITPPQNFSFIANRPFLLAIRNQQSGAILFMGIITAPK